MVLLASAGLGAWWWARQSLPRLDGELTLAGLRHPVEVVFDGHGVPHVYARDPEDAWFAAGVLHARDRLWQMELYRRVTRGRLAEALGASALPIDKRFLTLGLREAAEAEWTRLDARSRLAFERYAEGVNAVAAGLRGRTRPLEMQVLGLTPVEWTPVDSLAVGRLFAWRLSENHQAELVRAALAAALGGAAARQLAGRYPESGPTVLGGGSTGQGARSTGQGTRSTEEDGTPRPLDRPCSVRPKGGPCASIRDPASPRPGVAAPDGAAGQQQQLGAVRLADGVRAADPGQRSTPAGRVSRVVLSCTSWRRASTSSA